MSVSGIQDFSFDQAWSLAYPGQLVKHGDFTIVKGEFMSEGMFTAFYAGLPLDKGWEIDDSIAKKCSEFLVPGSLLKTKNEELSTKNEIPASSAGKK